MKIIISFVTIIFIIALIIVLYLLNFTEISAKFNSIETAGLNIAFSLFLIFFIIHLSNPILPEFMCNIMGWHLEPKKIGFDGCSLNGNCPRCNKYVLQDSQGNWF